MSTGDRYVADTDNNRVRGRITTVAGTGTTGYCGDGAPAVAACLNRPIAVAVENSGDVFIADTGNGRVRRVDRRTGPISTVAGRESCVRGNSRFPQFAAPSGDGGPAPGACLGAVTALLADAHGGMYLSAPGSVRHIDADGTIRTVAGSGRCPAHRPLTASPIGDGGPATDACLEYPDGLASTPDGSLLIADAGLNRLRAVGPSGTIRTLAGNGTAVDDRSVPVDTFCFDTCFPPSLPTEGPARLVCLPHPTGVAVAPDGSVFIAGAAGFFSAARGPYRPSLGPGAVWRLDPDGLLSLVAGNPHVYRPEADPHGLEGTPGRLALLAALNGLAVDSSWGIITTELNRVLAIRPTEWRRIRHPTRMEVRNIRHDGRDVRIWARAGFSPR